MREAGLGSAPVSVDPRTRAMAGVALVVAAAATAAPVRLLAAFGVAPADVTGAAAFGWRLFAMRNVWIAVQALRGDPSAEAAFLPVQVLDQAVFWHAYATRSVPRRASVLAATASGVIVALDLARRRSLPRW